MEGRVVEYPGLTFDDVLLLPRHSEILPCDTDLTTSLTPNLHMTIPILSAAMDTVTESRLAIALAKEGGIGFIHKNMTCEEQAKHVRAVKKYEAGVVTDPITVSPLCKWSEVKFLATQAGFNTFPVIDDNHIVLGLVTEDQIHFERNPDAQVKDFMVPYEDLVTLSRVKGDTPKSNTHRNCLSPSLPFSPEEIRDLMLSQKTRKIVVVDEDSRLAGLITWSDFEKSAAQPNACRDLQGRLIVGAAVGCGSDTLDRVEILVEAGVDCIVVDSSHGHSQGVLNSLKKIRKKYPTLPLIGGNVCTGEGAIALVKAGADAVKVGIGPGSICTTRVITGVGCPQLTAIFETVKAMKDIENGKYPDIEAKHISIIADGGVRYSGDMAKALAAGADCVMIGSLLAGTEESPGTTELVDGRVYKAYRGMGSLGAMAKGSADRYFQGNCTKFVPEGVEGLVPYKGHLKEIIHQLTGGLRSCMGLTGSPNISTLQTQPQFIRLTGVGLNENHPHNIRMTKEPPNYSRQS